MTRINILPPSALTDQHLIAEHLEINFAVSIIRRMKSKEIPQRYTLNKGHVTFFKNKVKYLKDRYDSIENEMRIRGFIPKAKFAGDDLITNNETEFIPNLTDYKIIVNRIIERINKRPEWYRKNSKKINPEIYKQELLNLIKNYEN